MKTVVSLMLAGLVVSGCAGSKTRQPVAKTDAHPPVIVTPVPMTGGRVVQVNPTAQFAVLNFPVGSMPPIGQVLEIYRGGLKVAEVRNTGPQKDDNTVAEFVIGEPREGDQVRTK